MKKMISTIALLAVLLSVFTVFSEAGYADSPVAVIPDSENEQKTTEGNSPSWYSVNGYPSWDDIVAIGDGERIKAPSGGHYLEEYQIKYINAAKGNRIYVYKTAERMTTHPETIEHGAKVYVVAEKGTASLIIYRTDENTARSGWVSTGLLTDIFPGHTVSVGTETGKTAENIGDPGISWSGDQMPGTECEYLKIDEPIENCVGFTLEYRAENNGAENCSGARSIHIYDGENWKMVGEFQYEAGKPYHIQIKLEGPTTLCAVAVPLKVERNSLFPVRTCVLDVLVEKPTLYMVDVSDFPALDAYRRLSALPQTLTIGNGEFTYFELETPIENCVYLNIPMTIEASDPNGHYEDVVWAAAFRDADAGAWIMTNIYEYNDGEYTSAILDVSDPVSVDAFSVFPYDAPNGCGSFYIGFNSSKWLVAFNMRDAADKFINSLQTESAVSNQPEIPMSQERYKDVLQVAGEGICALRTDGTVATWNMGELAEEIEQWRDIERIVPLYYGGNAIGGIREDGTVVIAGEEIFTGCYGFEEYEGWTEIADLADIGLKLFGLRRDGTVIATGGEKCTEGWNDMLHFSFSAWNNIKKILGLTNSNGDFILLGLTEDGTLYSSSTTYFIPDDWNGMRDVADVSCSSYVYCVLKNDGSVRVAGLDSGNVLEEVESWRDIKQICAGFRTVGLKQDGTVVTAGYEKTPDLSGWERIKTVYSCGEEFFGICEDGTVKCYVPENRGSYDDYTVNQEIIQAWNGIEKLRFAVDFDAGELIVIGFLGDGRIVSTRDLGF